jgi:hypothetical protein
MVGVTSRGIEVGPTLVLAPGGVRFTEGALFGWQVQTKNRRQSRALLIFIAGSIEIKLVEVLAGRVVKHPFHRDKPRPVYKPHSVSEAAQRRFAWRSFL